MTRIIDMTDSHSTYFSNSYRDSMGRFDGADGTNLPDENSVVLYRGRTYYREMSAWDAPPNTVALTLPIGEGPGYCPGVRGVAPHNTIVPAAGISPATFEAALPTGVVVRFANQNQLMATAAELSADELSALFPGGLPDAVSAMGHHPAWLYEDVGYMDPVDVITEMAAHQYLAQLVGMDNAATVVYDMLSEIVDVAYESMDTESAERFAAESVSNQLSQPDGRVSLRAECARYGGKRGPCYL